MSGLIEDLVIERGLIMYGNGTPKSYPEYPTSLYVLVSVLYIYTYSHTLNDLRIYIYCMSIYVQVKQEDTSNCTRVGKCDMYMTIRVCVDDQRGQLTFIILTLMDCLIPYRVTPTQSCELPDRSFYLLPCSATSTPLLDDSPPIESLLQHSSTLSDNINGCICKLMHQSSQRSNNG